MKSLHVIFDKCGLEQSQIVVRAAYCLPAINAVVAAHNTGMYDSLYASVNLPFDQQIKTTMVKHVQELRQLNPALLIVIGIGGSNLGTKAVQEACLGIYQQDFGMQIAYVDTVDPDIVHSIYEDAYRKLEAGCVVLINIVTKSGTTTETIANASIFVELLKQYDPARYGDYITVTTDTGSKLASIARKEGWRLLEVPPMVGGRYSVFSAVGLFPLALLGVDIDALLDGAAFMAQQCVSQDIRTNYAAQSAAILYELYQRGCVIHNFFPFTQDMCSLGLWYRQLVAESLGKECTLDGHNVNVGITPTVSIGSTDLHSMVELHLAGPANTVTTFVAVEQSRQGLEVPTCQQLQHLVAHIQGKSLAAVTDALLGGTQKAYAQARRPYMSVVLPDKSEEAVGQFMQWKMLEVMYLGHLFNINPFIQPQVESYKKEARALLAQE